METLTKLHMVILHLPFIMAPKNLLFDPQVKVSSMDDHLVTFPKKIHTFAYTYVL
jgi:hypothetical protein